MYRFWCGHTFSFLLGLNLGVDLLGNFSTFSLTIIVILFCDYRHPGGCEMVSHCSFDFHFPKVNLHFPNGYWASSHMFIGHFYIFLGEIPSFLGVWKFSVGLFVFLLVSCKTFYYSFIHSRYKSTISTWLKIISPILRLHFSLL